MQQGVEKQTQRSRWQVLELPRARVRMTSLPTAFYWWETAMEKFLAAVGKRAVS
jgi:hypothetical protein